MIRSHQVTRSPCHQKKRGAVLFLAVGALSVLSILALGISSSVLQELKLAQVVSDGVVAYPAAVSAIEAARLSLLYDETPQQLTLYELSPWALVVGDVTVSLKFSDEAAKITADTASKEVLMRLPGLGENEAVVDTLVASSVTTPEALHAAEGMTEELAAQCAPYLSVFGDGRVNINTAPAEVLAALGADGDLVWKILVFRAGDDAVGGTCDDRSFMRPSEITARLEPYGLSETQRSFLQALVDAQSLETTSSLLTFTASVTRGARVLGNFVLVKNSASGAVVFYAQE